MRLFRPFFLSGVFYPEAIFRLKTRNKELCLTFDDGPSPDSTPQILDILDSHSVKALFFCSGQAAEKYPDLITLMVSRGHIIGNHGYCHLNGWKTNRSDYLNNVFKADKFTSPHLFRPPYGRIKPAQYHELLKKYTIIFWDLMPYDYDKNMGNGTILSVLKKKIRPGSVIVLHDKISSSVLSFLSEFIKYAEESGYNFIIPRFSGKK